MAHYVQPKMALETDKLFAALPGDAWIALPDGRLELVSQSWCAFSGINLEPAHEVCWHAIVHPDDLYRAIDAWRCVVESGCPIKLETRLKRYDGEYRRALISMAPIIERLGQIAKCCGINTDIEDYRQIEEELRLREIELSRTHHHLVEGQRLSRTASFSSDPAIDEHTWSDEFYRICDFEVGSEATLQRLRKIVHPDDLVTVDTVIERSLAGHGFDVLFRIVTPKGALKYLRGVGRMVDRIFGRPIFVGAIQDVTEAKLTEAALREAERYSRLTLDSIPGLVAVFTAEGQVEYVNRPILEYFGSTAGDLSRWQQGDAVHPEDRAWVFERFAQAMASGVPFEWESRARRHDGVYRWVQSRGLPLRDEGGRIVRWYNLLVDVDERKRAEEALKLREVELRQAYDRLNEGQRLMTLGTFAASIAHEVNQPLTGIITNTSTCLNMLTGNPANLSGARTSAERALRDGNRAAQIIDRLRTLFSRGATKHEPIQLNDAVAEVIALCAHELQRNRVALRTEFAGNLPTIMGDRIQLQQVVLNLIVNAVDATKGIEGRSRDIRVGTSTSGSGAVLFWIRDSGVGIDPSQTEKLFDTFFTTKAQGMGVGLSISRSIIETHEGRLWAAANDGPGATFSFCIPCGFDSHRTCSE